jgi:MarR family transcriptional regulator, transcriptional regulator for hemolysin
MTSISIKTRPRSAASDQRQRRHQVMNTFGGSLADTGRCSVEIECPMLGFLLNDVARLLKKRFEQMARGFGLTRAQWQVLTYLDQNEGINQSGLAELLDLEPITLSRIVDRLESVGLIERHPHVSDRRVKMLRLTSAAYSRLARARRIGHVTASEALIGISGSESLHLSQTLQKLKSNLCRACDSPVRKSEQPDG